MLNVALASLALAAPPSLPPLRIEGKQFVDPSGRPVPLRGVNLGGWLVEEIWMTPVVENAPASSGLPDVKDHVSLWGTVERRLGRAAMQRVRRAWRESWIQEADFDRIKAYGFNHVRLPFLARLLDEPNGMDWLRKGVAMAKRRGLYVVLDMHGVPGSQSGEHHTGETGKNRLWFDVENIARTEAAWRKVAREFRGEPAVAVYDLINEPMGAPNPAMLHLVYDRLIRAIRTVDKTKPMLIDDGYKGFETTPHTNIAGWTQIGYSLHRYHFDAKAPEDHPKKLKEDLPKVLELQGYRNAPVYIGEFNLEPHGNADAMRAYVRGLDDAGFSWALWTYKTVNPKGPMGAWGLVSNPGPVRPLNAFADSERDMIEKLGQVRTENLKPVEGLLNAFRR